MTPPGIRLDAALSVVLAAWTLEQSFYPDARTGHACAVLRSPRLGEYLAICACGSRWTYASTSTDEYRRSVYESHLRFFDKPAQTVL